MLPILYFVAWVNGGLKRDVAIEGYKSRELGCVGIRGLIKKVLWGREVASGAGSEASPSKAST